jgi:hypothetical protein
MGLHGLCCDADAEVVAAAADGAAGDDLRELVTTAVLHTARSGDAGITTDLLMRLSAERSYRPPGGLYL